MEVGTRFTWVRSAYKTFTSHKADCVDNLIPTVVLHVLRSSGLCCVCLCGNNIRCFLVVNCLFI